MKKVALMGTSWSSPRRVSIETEFANPLPLINADIMLLEQAFINSLKNAIEASDDGGPVTITIFAGPVRLTIRNSGQVITPEIQQKLFTPFYSTKPTGQGIGLMLIREVLTRHKFQFSVQSNEHETEFTVWFV